MTQVVLGLGSNRSFEGKSPLEILALACAALKNILQTPVFSSVYKTGAMYVTDQDDFYNMVVLGSYDGSEYQLLSAIHSVENTFGRNREKEFRNGPRPLDIDIELFGNSKIHEADLVIPHERLTERAFVLKPLVEVLANYADVSNKDRASSAKKWLEEYETCLDGVKNQKIDLFLDASKFNELLK